MRWWDPGSGAHLLEPAGDPKLDLANALVEVHRVGAGAIATAKAIPAFDERTLITSIAAARANAAGPVVEAVAKTATVDVDAADVLVRDLWDAAESACVRLYRTAVAKGVAPPLAADRCAAVFGVPAGELGRYAVLALDPRTPPPAITDAADRALFAFVADVVGRAPESVAKMTSEQFADAKQEGRVRQDEHGRFATIAGMSAQDWLDQQMTGAHLDEVGTQAPATVGPAEVGRRRSKQVKRIKQVRRVKTRQQVRAAAQAEQRERTRREPAQRERSQRTRSPRQRAFRDLVTREMSRLLQRVPNLTGQVTIPDDLVAERSGRGPTQPLDDAVGFTMTLQDWTAFKRKTGITEDGARVFRAGALQAAVGDPSRVFPVPDSGHGERDTPHELEIAAVADQMRKDKAYVDQTAPEVRKLTEEEMEHYAAVDGYTREELAKEWKVELLRRYAADVGGPQPPISREIGNVFLVRDWEDEESFVLIYHPPPAAGHSRPGPPVVVDIRVEADDVRGYYDRPGRPGQVVDTAEFLRIAENQPLMQRLRSRGSEDDYLHGMPEDLYWDAEIGAYRQTVDLSATDEDDLRRARVKKAMTPEQFKGAVAEGEIHRGGGGRFIDGQAVQDWLAAQLEQAEQAEVEDTVPVAPAAPGRRKQVKRIKRIKQVRRVSAPQLRARERTERTPTLRERTERTPEQRELTRRMLVEAHRRPHSRGIRLDPYGDYVLYDDDGRESHLPAFAGSSSEAVPLAYGDGSLLGTGKNHHYEQRTVKADEVQEQLIARAADYSAPRNTTSSTPLAEFALNDDTNWHRLVTEIQDAFDAGHYGVDIRLSRVVDDGDTHDYVRVYGTSRALAPMHIVQWGHVSDPDAPHYLDFDHKDRLWTDAGVQAYVTQLQMMMAHNSRHGVSFGHHSFPLWNPEVQVWTVTTDRDTD